MSSPSTPDPYQPPAYQPPQVAAAVASANPQRRPGWFVAVCVIAIAIGATGFLHSLYALAGLTVGDPLEMFLSMQSADPGPAELEEISDRFEQQIADIEDSYYVALLPLTLARLALTVCLVIGGVGSLGGKSAARTLLIGTMAAALLFEVCDTLVQSFILFESAEPIREYGGALDPQVGELIMTIVFGGMMCVFYACQLAKVVYYLAGLLYLRRSSLDRLFQRTQPAIGS